MRWASTVLVGLALALAGCTDDADPADGGVDLVEQIADQVALREPTDVDFLLTQLLALGELEAATDADSIEARLLADDANEESFLLVLQREGGFDESHLAELIELGEDLSASPELTPVEGIDDAYASDCCIVRVLGDAAVVAGDFDGVLKPVVLQLDDP
jgi:hypothetical protein